MNERDALIAGICADPESDHHRLVYADWLEEFGGTSSDRARAVFIRMQCEIERLERWSPRWLDLKDAADEMLEVYDTPR